MNKKISLPVRAMAKTNILKIKVDEKKISAFDLKSVIRQFVKKNSPGVYHLDILIADGEFSVVNPKTGDVIKINKLHKWVFGVPGYMGHYQQRWNSQEELWEIQLPFVYEEQKFVANLVRNSVLNLEYDGIEKIESVNSFIKEKSDSDKYSKF